MVRNARLPSADVVKQLHEEGLTNKEIGDKYGVTSEAVRRVLKAEGLTAGRQRSDHSYYVPWRLRADHAHDVLAKRLRSYSKRQQGAPLSEDEERKLQNWIEFMDGANPYGLPLSVHYNRMDPEGFWLEPRQPGDRDYISPPAA